MLRLFVGIALPPELKLKLSLLASGVPGARWVDPGNYHVTLRFIGEVSEDVASDIDGAMLPLRVKPFELTVAGVGRFSDRMLWAGVEKSEALVHLRDKVESALVRLGLAPETRRYAPHISLARLRNASESKVQVFLREHALFRAAPFPVEKFSLVASYLTKAGPIYEDQADYELR